MFNLKTIYPIRTYVNVSYPLRLRQLHWPIIHQEEEPSIGELKVLILLAQGTL